MRTFNSDYIVGRASEEKYLPCLQNAFNDETLSHTKCKSDIFDYIGNNKYIELKTRSFEHTKYPDTMIGLNKIKYAQANPDKEFYFVFAFTDGLYYYKYKIHVILFSKSYEMLSYRRSYFNSMTTACFLFNIYLPPE